MNFRGMMRCVSGACCTMVVVMTMCGVSVVDDVRGMANDPEKETLHVGYDAQLRNTLALSFPCRIRNVPVLNHDSWIISFEQIAVPVAFLLASENCKVLDDLMQTISALSVSRIFRSFSEFLSSISDSCPVSSTVSGLFQLIHRAAVEIDETQHLGISDGFLDMVSANTGGHFGLQESKDLLLFQCFNEALPLEW